MRVAAFDDIREEFFSYVQAFVYCNMATIAPNNRPRSRIVHPIWEDNGTGWILSVPNTPKSKHLTHCPYVSLSYFGHSISHPVYLECHARFVTDREQQLRVWEIIKEAPPPMGFDPEPHYGNIDHPHWGVIQLEPYRIELYELRGEPKIWLKADADEV
jgi:general stress protein 26